MHSGDLHIRPTNEWRVQPNLGVSVAVNTKLLSEQLQLNDFAHWKRCLKLRMPSLLPLLYLASFYRATTERRPRELQNNHM